ncbi:MAG: hypothetical protein VYD19_00300 [Myxococcota bacterium]|nr:hypothetical protein [Myxococcota bacterium]
MSSIDHFESSFRAALQSQYSPRPAQFRDVLLLSDLEGEALDRFTKAAEGLLAHQRDGMQITVAPATASVELQQLLELIEQDQPDLICSYRNLHTDHGRWPYTLGDHVEVLTQITEIPILLLPRPELLPSDGYSAPKRVMALTGHLADSPELVDAALAFLGEEGGLSLSHIEDDLTFERYLEAIGRVPQIDTALAREKISASLLDAPRRFIEACQRSLATERPKVKVDAVVEMGHHLKRYRQLTEDKAIDLLVFPTKDDDQLAMHGMAYPLAIELRDLPLLML